MNILTNYIKNNKNVILIICIVIVILIALTIYNQNFNNTDNVLDEELYSNEVSRMVTSGDIENINYEMLLKDFNDFDNILKEQIALNPNRNKQIEYYKTADTIYTNKFEELLKILSVKLDKMQYDELILDISNFNRITNNETISLKNTIESSIEYKLLRNKYTYEVKQAKYKEILSTYKDFLK